MRVRNDERQYFVSLVAHARENTHKESHICVHADVPVSVRVAGLCLGLRLWWSKSKSQTKRAMSGRRGGHLEMDDERRFVANVAQCYLRAEETTPMRIASALEREVGPSCRPR